MPCRGEGSGGEKAAATGRAAVGRTGSPPTRLIFQSLSSVAFSVTGIGPSRTASVVTAAAAAADQVELETEAASVVVASSSSSERVVGS